MSTPPHLPVWLEACAVDVSLQMDGQHGDAHEGAIYLDEAMGYGLIYTAHQHPASQESMLQGEQYESQQRAKILRGCKFAAESQTHRNTNFPLHFSANL